VEVARARASLALREGERLVEYSGLVDAALGVRLADDAFGAEAVCAAAIGATPILTSRTSKE